MQGEVELDSVELLKDFCLVCDLKYCDSEHSEPS